MWTHTHTHMQPVHTQIHTHIYILSLSLSLFLSLSLPLSFWDWFVCHIVITPTTGRTWRRRKSRCQVCIETESLCFPAGCTLSLPLHTCVVWHVITCRPSLSLSLSLCLSLSLSFSASPNKYGRQVTSKWMKYLYCLTYTYHRSMIPSTHTLKVKPKVVSAPFKINGWAL